MRTQRASRKQPSYLNFIVGAGKGEGTASPVSLGRTAADESRAATYIIAMPLIACIAQFL
jgi:hypothetical protein